MMSGITVKQKKKKTFPERGDKKFNSVIFYSLELNLWYSPADPVLVFLQPHLASFLHQLQKEGQTQHLQ